LQSGNFFGDAGVIGLAEGLKSIASLQDLDLVRCPALLWLFLAFEVLLLVTIVMQMNNAFGDAGAVRLGAALKSNTSLRRLNLVSCSAAVLRVTHCRDPVVGDAWHAVDE
jgi:hypothetical protein